MDHAHKHMNAWIKADILNGDIANLTGGEDMEMGCELGLDSDNDSATDEEHTDVEEPWEWGCKIKVANCETEVLCERPSPPYTEPMIQCVKCEKWWHVVRKRVISLMWGKL